MRRLWRGRWFAGALTILSMVSCSRADRGTVPRRPLNVLLITIDTFRADRLGIGVAPTLDRLAAIAVQFGAARATVPLTLPSHTTIHTGLLPPVHGIRENGVDALSASHATIATQLKRAGYQTAGFIGAFVLDRRFGLAQGFDTYDDQIARDPMATDRLEAERPAGAVVDRALAWLDQHGRPEAPPPAARSPFFVWIHLYDPHAPYKPPPEFRGPSRSPYDGEIAYADAQVARVVAWLRQHTLMDRSLIVVAGDHGEGLGDHGERTHGMLLYDSTLRVPLFIVAPDHAPGRHDEAVTLADIAPTILRATGAPVPTEMNGRDLLAPLGRQVDLYSETEYPRVAGWTPLQALTDGRWKTIRAGATSEVYDLQNDPAESRDLSSTQSAIAAAMARTIDRINSSRRADGEHTVSREAEERLRALGYVGSSRQPGSAANAPNPAAKMAAWTAFEEALSALSDTPAATLRPLEKLAADNPDAELFQTTYARALTATGRLDQALIVYRAAAKRWPTDATLLHDLAVAARDAASHQHGAAAAALRAEAAKADAAAIALSPTNALAHNALGLTAIEENRPQAAVTEFERATTLDPNNASYWTNLGNARRAAADAKGAEQAYQKALEVEPRAADAANGLGVLFVEAHRAADAVPWLERAIAAAPDFVEARLNLGIALQQSGDAARAAIEYRRVLAAPPRFARERKAAAALLASLGVKP